MDHFYREDAEKYGIEKALILSVLENWIKGDNIQNGDNIFNGYSWTKVYDGFFNYFSYLPLELTKKHFQELVDIGVIKEGVFDEGNWYTIPRGFSVEHNIEKKNTKTVNGWIYLYKQGDFYKIGRSRLKDCRIKKYITENPFPIELVFKKEVSDYIEAEKLLHEKFKDKRISSSQEWFLLEDKDVKSFIKCTNRII